MVSRHLAKHERSRLGVALVILAILSPVSQADFSGSLYSSYGGLVGLGFWAAGTNLSWTVAEGSGYWRYVYTLEVPAHDISHMIVEVSDNFDDNNLWNVSWTGPVDVETFDPGPGNPGMPGSMHGVKFDETVGTTLTISFDSNRMPVWGDFYAKDGTGTYLYNSGFLADDPVVAAHDGAEQGHLLRPDTVVPVPGAMLLGSIGLVSAGRLLRRKKQLA